MKKIISIMLSLVIVLAFAACGDKETPVEPPAADNTKPEVSTDNAKPEEEPQTAEKTDLKITMIVNGNLGDRGLFDSGAAGLAKLKEDIGIDYKIIETGADPSKWEPALTDAADESDVDIVIALSPSMGEHMQKIAPMYPEKSFILLDATVDHAADDLSNVYSATFKQNEGSYLAGVLAASVTKSDLPNANEENIIGFVGGMDVPVINDFLVGYIQGAQFVDPEVKVANTFVGDYYNPAKGKEFGIVLANQKADIIFAAAGETGLGVIEAAQENDCYIVGVDADQAAQYEADGDMEKANIILSSMMKNVGDIIYRSVNMHIAGTLPYGSHEELGVKEGGIGLAKNDIFNKNVPEEIRAKIEEAEKKVASGEVEVGTAIGMPVAELETFRNSVKP